MYKIFFIDYVFSLGVQILFMWVYTKLLQLCPTLYNPMDCSLPRSSVGLSEQEYLGGLPCPPPGDLPEPGIEPESLVSSVLAGRFFTTSATWEAQVYSRCYASVSHPTCSLKFPSWHRGFRQCKAGRIRDHGISERGGNRGQWHEVEPLALIPSS